MATKKSPQRRLVEAAELLTLAKVSRRELVVCSVYGASHTTIHLTPPGWIKALEVLGVPRRKVEFRLSHDGNLHGEFSIRGAVWVCFVRGESDEGRRLRAVLAPQLEQSARPWRRLRAPEETTP